MDWRGKARQGTAVQAKARRGVAKRGQDGQGGTRINSSALAYGLIIHTSSVCYGYVRNQRAYSF